MPEDRDFLNRWSERKVQARRGELVDEAELPQAPQPAEAAQSAQPDADEPAIPEELRNIDIDALDYDADYTVFLKAGVPEVLRKKALRHLWRTNPVLACLDGLNDYEEDFTDLGIDSRGLASAYRVGKGYLFDEDETTDGDAEAEDEWSESPIGEAVEAEPAPTDDPDPPEKT